MLLRALAFCSTCMLVWPLAASPAVAQQGSLRVAVIRDTQSSAAGRANEVDRSLLRQLEAVAGIREPTISPMEYSDVQLTVGCSDRTRRCLGLVAGTIGVDAVLVRTLRVSNAGALDLALLYYDATSDDEPLRVQGTLRTSDRAVDGVVGSLVRRTFGIPEAVSIEPRPPGSRGHAEPAEEPAPRDATATVRLPTWIVLGAGAALALGAGALELLAARDFDDYSAIQVETRADADRALDLFDRASTQRDVAVVLGVGAGLALGAGVVLLILDVSRDDAPRERAATSMVSMVSMVSVGVSPAPCGGVVHVAWAAEAP